MTLLYDGTYEGLMTTVFDCYHQKLIPDLIVKKYRYQPGIFDQVKIVPTDMKKAERVLKGLRKKLTPSGIRSLHMAFHSELSDIEITIYNYIRLAMSSNTNIEQDYRQATVLRIRQVVKMVGREIHRVYAFVRFQKTADNIYAATIKPDFDVIPFIGNHFKKRYADQQWLIYDTFRDYGLFYDLKTLHYIKLNNPEWEGQKKIKKSNLSEGEQDFEEMWQQYFRATSIKARKNIKLHLQHMPRRYWHYLPEKS